VFNIKLLRLTYNIYIGQSNIRLKLRFLVIIMLHSIGIGLSGGPKSKFLPVNINKWY